MAQAVEEKSAAKKVPRRKWLYVLLALVPIVLIVLYYIFDDRKDIMDWVFTNISLPYSAAAAKVSSFSPFRYFSVSEVLITLLILWTLYFIARTIIILIRKPHRLFNLGQRFHIIAVVALYIFATYSWIWGAGYHSISLAEKTGLDSNGVKVLQLTYVTKLFAEKANELSSRVKRDADGHFAEDRQSCFALSKDVYSNIEEEFPEISGGDYAPKPMLYSKLMSAGGFSGGYIALTGETNINIDSPACMLPSTIAHEMAHQRGVNSEEEANFAAIAACITSDIPVYEYSGYLLGLDYLIDTLSGADPYAYRRITLKLNDDVLRDLKDNNDYWLSQHTQATETVTAVYDGYLKSNGVESGINSYGACVDMLVTWLAKK